MSKLVKILVLSLAVLLAVTFLTMLFLSVPMGNKDAVLPIVVLYVTGLVTAGLSFVGAGLFAFYRFRELTAAGRKYYDNRNSIDRVDK